MESPLMNDRQALHVVSYAISQVVGVPAILARCIQARTPHTSRCVWIANVLPNGVVFDGDIQWQESPAAAEAELAKADVVIIHNGSVNPLHQSLFGGKAVIVMAHQEHYVDPKFVKQGFPCVVVGQHQATLAEYKGWFVVPNPIPLWEEAFQPAKKNEVLTICYTPSGKHERHPPGHWWFWYSKGYRTTMEILHRLAARWPLRLDVIRDRQLDHAKVLEMKRAAHIVIDECVTGSYHRNSLEGLAAGCVVVNALGDRPDIVEAFRYCSCGETHVPFTYANLETLESVLDSLIQRGPEALAMEGAKNRQWMEKHWDFAKQWQRFWMPAVTAALHHAGTTESTCA